MMQSLHRFPVAWSNLLPQVLGNIQFSLQEPRQSYPREWLAIVSSHDRKTGYYFTDWQACLRSALQLAHEHSWGVALAEYTPYSNMIAHACRRMKLPLRVIRIEKSKAIASTALEAEETCSSSSDFSCLQLTSIEDNLSVLSDGDMQQFPLHDRAAVFLSDRVFAVHVRRGGKMERLLESRLHFAQIPSATTYIGIATDEQNSRASNAEASLVAKGAVGWPSTPNVNLSPQLDSANRLTDCDDILPIEAIYQPIIPLNLLGDVSNRYLVHCTRARSGPWPDQNWSQFYDELIQCPWSSAPTPLDTLIRILGQQRLIATKHLRRHSETVCFSEKPLRKLLAMRQFRSHLSRWDWEPYGIMIDLAWLKTQGAKPVTYLDEAITTRMPDTEMTFCQAVSSKFNSYDWRQEQEWRLVGDLPLKSIPSNKALVFTKYWADARIAQRLSRWPIVVVSNISSGE